MKKGFTLIELLAVIVLLGILAVIITPMISGVIEGAKVQAYNQNIEAIKKAAYDWGIQNTKYLPKNENDSIIVYLGELKLNSTIDTNIKNPKNGKLLSNNTSVTITKKGNSYDYTVNVVEVDVATSFDVPVLVISGDIIDYVEVNQDGVGYTIPSVQAKSSTGEAISNSYISYQIIEDGNVVTEVDTSKLGIYTLSYSVTYNGATGNYEKKVVVRDTTKPVLNLGDNIVCTVDNIPTDLLAGVTVTDNSGEEIVPDVRSEINNSKGTYYVYYTATDSSGNSITKRKEVSVN